MFYGAFPDLKQTVEDTIVEGDKVVLRFTMRGTHRGDLMGMAATHKTITIGGIAILRIGDGKVAELRDHLDQMGIMQQLDAMPVWG
jgi:predicted ester cyclase